ncbi:MAG TPA: hypothetical protein PLX85_00095 [Dehalococcoidia bacterium]|nr:hypothetical protein [Dehalococcoidia bacterium]
MESAPQRVIVTDVDIKFGSMVTLLIKLAFAALPAAIFVGAVGFIAVMLAGGIGGSVISALKGGGTPASIEAPTPRDPKIDESLIAARRLLAAGDRENAEEILRRAMLTGAGSIEQRQDLIETLRRAQAAN